MAYSKFAVIVTHLREMITGRQLKKGDKLPTESELSRLFGVSRQTTRKALSELSGEGLIKSVQGSGSYVTYEMPEPEKTMQIAVITSYINEYVFPSVLRGIDKRVSAAGYTVSIRSTNNSIANERRILEDILDHPVDAIAVEGTKTTMPNPNLSLYCDIAKAGIPIVMFNNYYPGLELPGYPHVITSHNRIHPDFSDSTQTNIRHVIMDDYAGAYALAEKLINNGHRTIGGVFKSDDMQGYVRFSGYLDCMLDHRADYRDENTFWYTTETADILKRYLKEHVKDLYLAGRMFRDCTALICYNDMVAQLILRTLENLDITHNIRAVYSFDRHLDLYTGDNIETYSLGYPENEIGGIVGQKLLDMIDRRETVSDVLSWEH